MKLALKVLLNDVLRKSGFQIVRQSTLNQLISKSSDKRYIEDEERNDETLQRNTHAHTFRSAPDRGGPTQAVPVSYLTTLQRESLALRDTRGEIARLKRELEIIKSGQGPNSQNDLGPQSDGISIYTPVYDYDGIRNDPHIIHNHDFMKDDRFIAAYKRAVSGAGVDQRYYWRAHVAIWCASIGLRLDGDFVECGVWKGLLSMTIMRYFDWNTIPKRFFLFDTFTGVDETQLTKAEIDKGTIAHFREMYKEDLYTEVVRNFAEFKNASVVQGSVPGTLQSANLDRVAYLSIDMNNATPEIAAIEHLWSKLAPGAPVLLDDYGFINYEEQKKAWDNWAAVNHVHILALPTGQGLIIKPGDALRT